MNITIDLNTIILSILTALILWGLAGIFAMKECLNSLRTSIAKIVTWSELHGDLDEERHRDIKENLAVLWRKVDQKEREK